MLEKTMLIKMNQQAYGTTRFQILTGDQVEQIYFAALDVLEISGARIFHEEALQLFTNSDAVVSETDRVRIPSAMVERARVPLGTRISLVDVQHTVEAARIEDRLLLLEADVVDQVPREYAHAHQPGGTEGGA